MSDPLDNCLPNIKLIIGLNPSNPPGMRRRSDVSVKSHIGRDIANHAETSSRRRNRYVNETTYLRRLCDVSLVRRKN